MTKDGFLKFLPNCGDCFDDANDLYMVLPTMSKEAFCALWTLDRTTQCLNPVRTLLERYRAAAVAVSEPGFLRPLHETEQARAVEFRLKDILGSVKEAVRIASMNPAPENER